MRIFLIILIIFLKTLILTADEFTNAVQQGKNTGQQKYNEYRGYFNDMQNIVTNFGSYFSDNDSNYLNYLTNRDNIDTTDLQEYYGRDGDLRDYVNNIKNNNFVEDPDNIYANREFQAFQTINSDSLNLTDLAYNSINNPNTSDVFNGNFNYGSFSLGDSFEDCSLNISVSQIPQYGHIQDIVTCEKEPAGLFVCYDERKYEMMISSSTDDVIVQDGKTWYKKCSVTDHSFYYYTDYVDNSECTQLLQNLASNGVSNCQVVSQECVEWMPITYIGETGTKTGFASCNNDQETNDHQCGFQWDTPTWLSHCIEVVHDASWEECQQTCINGLGSWVRSSALENVVRVVSWNWISGDISASDYGCVVAEVYKKMSVVYEYRNPDCQIDEGIVDMGYNRRCVKVKKTIVCGSYEYNGGDYSLVEGADSGIDTCQDMDLTGCRLVSLECLTDADGNTFTDENGNCTHFEYTYDCGEDIFVGNQIQVERSMNCAGNIRCMGTECADADEILQDYTGLVEIETNLKLIDKMIESADPDNFKIFDGEQHECTKAPMWGINCCSSDMAPQTSWAHALNYMKLAHNVYKAAKLTGLYEKFLGNTGQALDTLISKVTFWNPFSSFNAYYTIGNWADNVLGHEFASMIFEYQADEYGNYFAVGLTDTMSNIITVVGIAYTSYQIFNTIGQIFFGCKQSDMETVALVKQGRCHYVGIYCKKKVLGKCLQKAKIFCCYQDFFSLWFFEQLRSTPQPELASSDPIVLKWRLDRDDGNCGGITPEILEQVNFDNFDPIALMAYYVTGLQDIQTNYPDYYEDFMYDWFDNYIAATASTPQDVENEVDRRLGEFYDNGSDRFRNLSQQYLNQINELTPLDINTATGPLLNPEPGDYSSVPDGTGAENNSLQNITGIEVINSNQNTDSYGTR